MFCWFLFGIFFIQNILKILKEVDLKKSKGAMIDLTWNCRLAVLQGKTVYIRGEIFTRTNAELLSGYEDAAYKGIPVGTSNMGDILKSHIEIETFFNQFTISRLFCVILFYMIFPLKIIKSQSEFISLYFSQYGKK